MLLTVNILNKIQIELDTKIELCLANYKDEISKNIDFNIDSYVIKHQKYGTISWDTKISELESVPCIYLVHVIRG